MLPGLAITALLALVTGALPTSAATARPTGIGTCDTTPVFFGLHGMAEGPSLNISAISPELESFDSDQNAISGAVLTYPVSYTTVYPNALSVLTSLYGALVNGENNLQAAITKGPLMGHYQGKADIRGRLPGIAVVYPNPSRHTPPPHTGSDPPLFWLSAKRRPPLRLIRH